MITLTGSSSREELNRSKPFEHPLPWEDSLPKVACKGGYCLEQTSDLNIFPSRRVIQSRPGESLTACEENYSRLKSFTLRTEGVLALT